MKCSFCGKELTDGAEFCPECGMILSIGGVSEEPEVKAEAEEEAEVPEYTPNVFKAMDFEEEPVQPAMELEVNDIEETAVVVEAVPEYVAEIEEIEEAGEAEQEVQEEPEAEEIYVAPEYDPNAKVSAEFMQQIAEEAETEEAEEAEETEETEYPADEIVAEKAIAVSSSEEEFAPPEYNPGASDTTLPEEATEVEDSFEDISSGAAEEAYPEYSAVPEESIPEEKFTEDENLFAALFEESDSEKLEDITPVDEKPEKASKKSFASVAVLLIVLVGVVIAGGYVFKNVLPKIVDTSNTTTASTEEKVDATTKPGDKTTTKADKSTTENTTTEKATTDKATTTEAAETEEPTTETTTEKESTTKAPEKTTEPTTESAGSTVVEPSSYNVDEVAFFPISGDISIKAGPSASSADMMMHPYGYPVYAYAKEGSYYYVDSPILDFMGWVSEDDLEEYVEEPVVEATTSAPEAEETPEADTSYTAVIASAEGLNFRTGPGSDYEIKYTVPGGYRVRVTKESSENPGWVFVTIEDDSYPYGSPSGWVSAEFLS